MSDQLWQCQYCKNMIQASKAHIETNPCRKCEKRRYWSGSIDPKDVSAFHKEVKGTPTPWVNDSECFIGKHFDEGGKATVAEFKRQADAHRATVCVNFVAELDRMYRVGTPGHKILKWLDNMMIEVVPWESK